MNHQLEQLMLNEPQELDKPIDQTAEIGRMKERLRILEDLTRHKGYQILMESIKAEATNCLYQMDRAETPHKATQYGANYFTLTQIAGFVTNEQAKLVAMLKSINAL